MIPCILHFIIWKRFDLFKDLLPKMIIKHYKCQAFSCKFIVTDLRSGLGIGVSARSLSLHGIAVDAVDIDPTVIKYSKEFFDLPSNVNTIVGDGLQVASNIPPETYDFVLHDVFTGGSLPSHLFTIEAFSAFKKAMRNDGVMAMNFVGSWDERDMTLRYSLQRTLMSLFPYVTVCRERVKEENTWGNMVYFASEHPIVFRVPEEEDYLDGDSRYHALNALKDACKILEFSEQVSNQGVIITNERNPLQSWLESVAEGHWKIMRQTFPTDEFWINF